VGHESIRVLVKTVPFLSLLLCVDHSMLTMRRTPQVAEFLDVRHGGHYMVVNLCSERSYDEGLFHGRVLVRMCVAVHGKVKLYHMYTHTQTIPIDDHHAPALNQMEEYSQHVQSWLAKHPKNVVAVHCKGGKGRTGVMVCAWLIASGRVRTPAGA
jgi:hypothetical protein